MKKTLGLSMGFFVFACWAVGSLRADQVVLQNGDTLNGKVLSLTTNALILQSDNLGSVSLPRSKVTAIHFGIGAANHSGPAAAGSRIQIQPSVPGQTNSASDLSAAVRGIRGQTNLIQQVQSQLLGSASPEATAKFNELLDGLSTGKIDLNDLRQQAQAAADQLRSLKQDLGPDAKGEADTYLAILDSFLQETGQTIEATNLNSAAPKAKPNTGQAGQ
jgi:hypothetical protein